MSDVKDTLIEMFVYKMFHLNEQMERQEFLCSVEEAEDWAEMAFDQQLIIHQMRLPFEEVTQKEITKSNYR